MNEVNVDAIMQEIRQQILAQKQGRREATAMPLGEKLPPEFYEHLYYAELQYDQIEVKSDARAVPIPVVGGLLGRLRGMIHQVVVYYVNQSAAHQKQFNYHILQAVKRLGEAAEEEKTT